MPAFSIIPYHPRYQPQFHELNRRWIEQFYVLEEEDKQFLADPYRHIIAPGGMVFFLLEGDVVAGTCGIMKMDDHTYELVRMSVDSRFRGKGYGEALVNHACEWARKQGARQVILETGDVLKTAIALYERNGFSHYTPEAKHRSGLARANVFMRRELHAPLAERASAS
jgi:GNAT superfamily N-acetyltransferase